MKKGFLIGPELLRQIREAVRYYINHGDRPPNRGANIGPVKARRVRARLNEDLLAATNTMNDPSYAQATILERGPNGDLYEGELIRITNRFENISVDAGTYVKAEWLSNEWELCAAGSPSGDLTVRFRIVASYFCGQCYADARVISVPYGVSLTDLPDVDTYDNNALRVYDRTGRFLNEPPEDLINRIGYARYMTPLEDGPCPDTYFPAWEIISLPCSEVTCD